MKYINTYNTLYKSATLGSNIGKGLSFLKSLIGVSAVTAGIGAGVNAVRGDDIKRGAIRGAAAGAGMSIGSPIGHRVGKGLRDGLGLWYGDKVRNKLMLAPAIGADTGTILGGITGYTASGRALDKARKPTIKDRVLATTNRLIGKKASLSSRAAELLVLGTYKPNK